MVVLALVQMGYKRAEAERAIEGLDPEEDLALSLRKALANLGIQREELNKETIMLKTSLLDKSQVEFDLRAQLASVKDAEAAQPHASATSAAVDAAKLSAAHAEVARMTAELGASHAERRAEAGPSMSIFV